MAISWQSGQIFCLKGRKLESSLYFALGLVMLLEATLKNVVYWREKHEINSGNSTGSYRDRI